MRIKPGGMVKLRPLRVEAVYHAEIDPWFSIEGFASVPCWNSRDVEEVIPAPRPLAAGERVRIEGRDIVEIIAIHNQYAWCKWPDDASQSLGTVLLTDLTRA